MTTEMVYNWSSVLLDVLEEVTDDTREDIIEDALDNYTKNLPNGKEIFDEVSKRIEDERRRNMET